MVEDDAPGGRPLRPRRHHIVPRPLLVGEGAHVPGDPHPAEQHVDAHEQAEVRLGQRHQDHDDVEKRHLRPDLDKTLQHKVKPSAEEAHHATDADPDDIARHQGDEGKADGDAKAVDQARQHIATAGVGAEEVALRQVGCVGRIGLLLEVLLIGVPGHQGQQHPVPLGLLRKLGLQLAVVGLVLVIEPEVLARDHIAIGGKVDLSLIAHRQCPAVDQELCQQGDNHQDRKDDKGVVAALDRLEALEFFQGYRIQVHAQSPNRTRGSTRATQMSETILPTSISMEVMARMPMTVG
ncbi:hypothetical protein D3C79_723410 [compost metagenome]